MNMPLPSFFFTLKLLSNKFHFFFLVSLYVKSPNTYLFKILANHVCMTYSLYLFDMT